MEPILWFGWFRADIIAEYGVMFWRGLQMTILVTVICIVQGPALGLASLPLPQFERAEQYLLVWRRGYRSAALDALLQTLD